MSSARLDEVLAAARSSGGVLSHAQFTRRTTAVATRFDQSEHQLETTMTNSTLELDRNKTAKPDPAAGPLRASPFKVI
jgi:hypothetical protein